MRLIFVKMLKVGLTGGIGSGKTTVARLFETCGIAVYYADEWAKWLMEHDPLLVEQIRTTFGQDIYDPQGHLQRPALAKIIFADPQARRALESWVHPAVLRHTEEWIQQHQASPYILKEAALLFESGSYQYVDKIITVTAPVELRIARTMIRDQASAEQVQQRIAAQLPDETKIQRSDFVIYNDEQHLLIPQVQQIHQQLLQIAPTYPQA
ncbi:MAG TPA: dephospho-CoA kinase [Chitinophagales bacterium]|nr:dephospho-CoA kinase [Chitinophagales bacterium]